MIPYENTSAWGGEGVGEKKTWPHFYYRHSSVASSVRAIPSLHRRALILSHPSGNPISYYATFAKVLEIAETQIYTRKTFSHLFSWGISIKAHSLNRYPRAPTNLCGRSFFFCGWPLLPQYMYSSQIKLFLFACS